MIRLTNKLSTENRSILIDWWAWRMWWFYSDLFKYFLPWLLSWSVDLSDTWWDMEKLRLLKSAEISRLWKDNHLSILFALPFFTLSDSHARSIYNSTNTLFELWYPRQFLKDNDLLITLTSVQSSVFDILWNSNSSILWIHNLHKDPLIDKSDDSISSIQRQFRNELSKQTVLIVSKGENHLWWMCDLGKHKKWWNDFFKFVWYWNVISDISPDDHDKLMASVQFLTSSMFLVWWLILKHYWLSINKEISPVTFSIQEIVKRILTQSHLTYQSIGKENKYNAEVFKIWNEKVRLLNWKNIEDLMENLVKATKETVDLLIDNSFLDRKFSNIIHTPLSKVRNRLLRFSSWTSKNFQNKWQFSINMSEIIEKYKIVLNNPELLYKNMFDDLRQYFPDFNNNLSNSVIKRAERE